MKPIYFDQQMFQNDSFENHLDRVGWFVGFIWAMKKKHGFFLGYTGDDKLPSYMGIIINHEIRIPIKQPV